MVVRVQAIGDAAEAAERLEPLTMRVSIVLRARSTSRRVGAVVAELRQLLVDRLLELLGRVPGPRRRLDLEDRAERSASTAAPMTSCAICFS